MALFRWTHGGERHRYAIAWPGELGTDPMAVEGVGGQWTVDTALRTWEEEEEIDRFSLGPETKRLARDGTAGPVSQDQIRKRERGQGQSIFPVQLTTSRICSHTRFAFNLLNVMTLSPPLSNHRSSRPSTRSPPPPPPPFYAEHGCRPPNRGWLSFTSINYDSPQNVLPKNRLRKSHGQNSQLHCDRPCSHSVSTPSTALGG